MSGCTRSRSHSSLFVHVYLPTAFLGIAMGASAPVIPLAALQHGASVAQAGVIVAAGGIGTLIADVPAGRLVAQIGERWSLLIAGLIGTVGAVLCVLGGAPSSTPHTALIILTAGVAGMGVAQAVWGLARQSYLTVAVPGGQRARAISAMAGMHRLGFFIGPFLGAVLLHGNNFRAVFAIQLVSVMAAAVLMSTLRDVPTPGGDGASSSISIWSTMRTHREPLLRLGPAAFALGTLRAARMIVLPLWAAHIGMTPTAIAVLFGVAGAIDVALSYPAGVGLDRWGRRAMAVPSTMLFAAALLILPLTDAPQINTTAGMWAATILLGVGNGLTNGLVMTIGADIAPADARPQFLSLWRLVHDAGMAVTPAAVGAIAALAGLAASSIGVGLVGLGGTLVFWRRLPAGVPRIREFAPEQARAEPRPAPDMLGPCGQSSSASPRPPSGSTTRSSANSP